jgi:uncharacterized damage-inducible protein DinB
MTELEKSLTGDSAFAPPSHILQAIPDELAHAIHSGATHSIYAELWHLTYWQQITLDWAAGVETPVPTHAAEGFPTTGQTAAESWHYLHSRFFRTLASAAHLTRDPALLARSIRCPSPPGLPKRTMTVEDQLISLAAHNAYHLGRIVLLRQLAGAWPPPSGGFTW